MISYEELCAALESHNAAQQAGAPPIEDLPAEEYAVEGDALYVADEGAGEADLAPAPDVAEEPLEELSGDPLDSDEEPALEEQPAYDAEQPAPLDAEDVPVPAEEPADEAEGSDPLETSGPAVGVMLAGPRTESAPPEAAGEQAEGEDAEGEDAEGEDAEGEDAEGEDAEGEDAEKTPA